MSGTSLDGVDAALVEFCDAQPILRATYFCSYGAELREQLLALHYPGHNELDRASVLSNRLSHLYAEAVTGLLQYAGFSSGKIAAIGCHGQTIRHCPEPGRNYTIQLVNAALLAELSEMTVVADFRSRDIAAGGQGAPLVPAFHASIFRNAACHRIIINIGGIANITSLDPHDPVTGFDCGPGNLLMDAWCLRHLGKAYDQDGCWAQTGNVIDTLLETMLAEAFFTCKPPKSTGRDLFNPSWLGGKLTGSESPQDVQATLLQLTAVSIVQAVEAYCPTAKEVYVCGGGAHNSALMRKLTEAMPDKHLAKTDQLGVAVDWVEAYAFAWLARQTMLGRCGNLAAVTGAQGERILGAIYPA